MFLHDGRLKWFGCHKQTVNLLRFGGRGSSPQSPTIIKMMLLWFNGELEHPAGLGPVTLEVRVLSGVPS